MKFFSNFLFSLLIINMKDDPHSKNLSAKKSFANGLYLSKLVNVRIIQKHLVYVIGLSSNLANKEVIIILTILY